MVFLIIPVALAVASASAVAQIEVHGHRGARAMLPEETLPAFQYALEVGADVLELDLVVTRDRKLLVSHDPHFNKDICLDPQGKRITEEPLIYSMTLAQAKMYDCGTLRNPNFPNQKPVPGTPKPTFEEVLELVKNSPLPAAKRVRFNVETKIFPEHPEYSVSPKEFTKLVVDVLKKYKVLDRTILQSLDYRTLDEAKKLDPKIEISALSEIKSDDLLTIARTNKPNDISPEWDMLTPEVVKALHKMKVKVVPWTVNEPKVWDRMVDLKVDAIITDDPEGLIRYLESKGLRKPNHQ